MKRIPRDPLKFDIFDAYAEYGREGKVSLYDPKVTQGFLARIQDSIDNSQKDARFIHGQWAQAMFEALVIELGNFQIMKQEDAGRVHVEDSVKVPDFRMVLNDGSQMLIEVKNFYQGDKPEKSFELSQDYFTEILRYSSLMNFDVKIAVYWVVWNMWTLVSPSVFQKTEKKMVLPLVEAMRMNEMAKLGDMSIGTKFPLGIRVIADPTKPRSIDKSGKGSFSIAKIELFCADRVITDKVERNVSLYLMLYGNWKEEPLTGLCVENLPEYVEYRLMPLKDNKQGFEIIGELSSMFSRFYAQATVEGGKIGQLKIDITPGSLGQLIPKDYQGKVLPLWRFCQKIQGQGAMPV